MRRCLAAAGLLLLWAAPVSAQHLGHGASGLPHGIPDFCELVPSSADRIVVAVGQTLTLSGAVQTSCLGVHGTLTVTPGAVLTVDNVLLYADGTLVMDGATIIIRDRPIDTATDPEQFGQGLIGFGRVTIRGSTIRSANPGGVRGHVLFTQRADVYIADTQFLDLGRTRASDPVDSTTFDAAEVPTHLGTNQLGRYALHLHHVMGPLLLPPPGRQFQLLRNTFLRDSKWGLVLHNSHFGLLQGNRCTQSAAACYVEENGSETDNHWIGNYAGQAAPTGPACDVNNYDPEGRCPTGFWLRGQNAVVKDNVVEDIQRGIVWWSACLEVLPPHPCALSLPVTIPKAPGLDTNDPANIETCKGGDGSPAPCVVRHRVAQEVNGNIIRRADAGLEFWWTPRPQNGGPFVTNTVTEDVKVPVLLHYTDAAIDTLTATGCGTLVAQFNDGTPIGWGPVESTVRRSTAVCSDAVYRRNGQLHQAPAWRWEASRLDAPNGIVLTGGGQRVVGYPNGTVAMKDLVMPRGTVSLTTSTAGGDEPLPEQTITVTATNVNGMNFVLTWPDGASPTPPPIPPTPTPVPPPSTVTVPCTVQSVGTYADKDAKLTTRCDTNGKVLIPKGTTFTITVPVK